MYKFRIPATSANLGPGFDCLGIALKLYNYYTFSKIDRGIKFDFKESISGKQIKLSHDKNLTYKVIKNTFDIDFGIEVRAKISIPIARGLGSSAAAIIAGLVGINLMMGQPLTKKEMLNKAIEIEGHPDNITPAFQGGYNINMITDESWVNKKINIDTDLKIILVIPEFEISTKKLREVLPEKISYEDAIYNHSRTALLTSCFYEGNWDYLYTAMKDRLHQDYRAKFIPGFHKIIKSAYNEGAKGVALSGSGPTLIAFANKNCDKIGKKMVNIFNEHGIKSNYIITEPDNKGTKIY